MNKCPLGPLLRPGWIRLKTSTVLLSKLLVEKQGLLHLFLESMFYDAFGKLFVEKSKTFHSVEPLEW